jgi:hypothetical protein
MAYTTIDLPSDYFNTVLYTGNGSTQSITGLILQPDFVWLKEEQMQILIIIGGQIVLEVQQNILVQVQLDAEATESSSLTGITSDWIYIR